ncbi:hypothetical protein SLA2020_372500 [Shorea laevis]
MRILSWVCGLVVGCFVLDLYRRPLEIFTGMLMADVGTYFQFLAQRIELRHGFWRFGHLSLLLNVLGLFLMFCLGLVVLQFGLPNKAVKQFLRVIRGKSRDLRKVFPSNQCFGDVSDAKIRSSPRDSLKFSGNSKSSDMGNKRLSMDLVNGGREGRGKGVFERESNKKGCFVEDEEFDVMALRKLVKLERKRANTACAELEKERMASSSAADEAMAMILRLQSEKSAAEMEANQYRRMAEEKHEYDQEVIQSLQWLVMKYESDVKLLEDQLQACKQKMALHVEDDELDLAN